MSSLAAVGADGYYYPPDYDGNKHRSLRGYNKVPNARKLKTQKKEKASLVVRFEMPYNVSCCGCGKTIAKGVRFNAEKRQHGAYYTTKIWTFRMKTPCCKSVMEIRTDPKNTDYIVVEGAKRMAAAEDRGEGSAVIDLASEDARASSSDAIEALERSQQRRSAVARDESETARLMRRSAANARDDYAANRSLRAENRRRRKRETALAAEGEALGLRGGVRLLEPREDEPGAGSFALLRSRRRTAQAGKEASRKRTRIQNQSIF